MDLDVIKTELATTVAGRQDLWRLMNDPSLEYTPETAQETIALYLETARHEDELKAMLAP